jgi:hypothetical protein
MAAGTEMAIAMGRARAARGDTHVGDNNKQADRARPGLTGEATGVSGDPLGLERKEGIA